MKINSTLFVDKVIKSDHKNGVKRAGCEFNYIAIECDNKISYVKKWNSPEGNNNRWLKIVLNNKTTEQILSFNYSFYNVGCNK